MDMRRESEFDLSYMTRRFQSALNNKPFIFIEQAHRASPPVAMPATNTAGTGGSAAGPGAGPGA